MATEQDQEQDQLAILHWDRAGNPMTFEDWMIAFENDDIRRLARYAGKGLVVSTVWLGLNVEISGPPRIFETAVFRLGKNGEREGPALLLLRYPTESEALEGHRKLENLAKRGRLARELDYRPSTREASSSSGADTAPRAKPVRLDYPPRVCEQCGTMYTPHRKDQRFDSAECRKLWANHHKPTTRAERAGDGPSEP